MHSKKAVVFLVAFLIVIGSVTIYYTQLRQGRVTLPKQYYAAHPLQSGSSIKPIAHVVIIVEENKPKTAIIGSADAPYINSLANTYALAQNYYAVTNPSLPNYIALTSGSPAGISNDCIPGPSCQANVQNIADEIEKSKRTWKEYAESMPAPCVGTDNGEYAVRHNPFVYYPDIVNNKARCTKQVVPFTQLASDLTSTTSLPDYSFITPNLCSDTHDCSVKTGDTWLAQVVPTILGSPAFTKQHSLLFIVWDEGNSGNNNIPAIAVGPAAKRGYKSNTYLSHYSLLRTIEEQWSLSPLTANDKNAPVMNDLLQ